MIINLDPYILSPLNSFFNSRQPFPMFSLFLRISAYYIIVPILVPISLTICVTVKTALVAPYNAAYILTIISTIISADNADIYFTLPISDSSRLLS